MFWFKRITCTFKYTHRNIHAQTKRDNRRKKADESTSKQACRQAQRHRQRQERRKCTHRQTDTESLVKNFVLVCMRCLTAAANECYLLNSDVGYTASTYRGVRWCWKVTKQLLHSNQQGQDGRVMAWRAHKLETRGGARGGQANGKIASCRASHMTQILKQVSCSVDGCHQLSNLNLEQVGSGCTQGSTAYN